MKKRITALLLTALLLCGVGCTGPKAIAQGKGEEVERLVIYTSHTKEVYGPLIKEFQERTGIWVEVRQGGSNELMREIAQQGEKPACDVLFGGGIELHQTNQQYFMKYQCADAQTIQSKFADKAGYWTAFSCLPLVIVYNTKLLEGYQVPKGWEELTKEEWKGKIAFANPEFSGSCYTALATIVQVGGKEGWERLRKFKENVREGQLDGSSEILEAVVGGAFPVGIALEEAALRLAGEGEPIGIVYPEEGTSAVPDASSIVSGAPNFENAKLFIDFTVCKDVQNMISTEFQRRPVRGDINVPHGMAALGEILWHDYDLEWGSSHRNEIVQWWASQ